LIRIDNLAAVPRKDAAQLLKLAPGVFLTNEGGSGHPYQIFLRGFDAREGQDLEFTVEGIPVNEVGNPHGNGLVDTHFVLPELVQSLRVIEGPFSPQQGNFAVAGSANFELGLDQRGLAVHATTGSFGTRRLALLWGPEGHSTHTFGGAEIQSTDGFGQNRAGQRATGMASYERAFGDKGVVRFLLSSYATHYLQAGVLRVDDLKAGRKGFYDTYDSEQGGDSARHSFSVRVDDAVGQTALSTTAYVVRRDFRLRENYTGFLEDPQQTSQSPHEQRGDLIDQQMTATTLGFKASARQTFDLLGQKQQLEFGLAGRHDDVDAGQARERSGTTIPYRTDLSLQSGITDISLYADGQLKPASWLTLRGGARADFFSYRVLNRCALTGQSSFGGDAPDTECFSSDRQGYRSPEQTASTAATAVLPRATLLVGPFAGFVLSVSHGLGARSIDPQYINQNLDTPFARVTATEGGVGYLRELGSVAVTARSVFFQTKVDKDLFFNETEGRNTLASGTTRTGWAGNFRLTGDFFDLAANLTLVRAIFDDTKLLIPYAPDLVARTDASLFGPVPGVAPLGSPVRGALGLGYSYVGKRPLPYGERSDVISLLDASASLRWRAYQITVTSTNLAGRKYRQGEYNYVSDFHSQPFATLAPARHFTAGEPRAVYATFSLFFGGQGS
jgi:hypothetical protein